MKAVLAFFAINAALIAAQLIGAVTMLALGLIVKSATPAISNEWWVAFFVGAAGIFTAVAFLYLLLCRWRP